MTTMAAVSDGMPPTACVTSMAMGVVTDFDASDTTTIGVAPSSLAVSTTLTMPTTQPMNCDMRMGMSCLRMDESWR